MLQYLVFDCDEANSVRVLLDSLAASGQCEVALDHDLTDCIGLEPADTSSDHHPPECVPRSHTQRPSTTQCERTVENIEKS